MGATSHSKALRVACAALTAALLAVAAPAHAQVDVTTDRESAVHAGEFVVPVNKSRILQVDQQFEELLVGNSEIADVLALTNRTIYVLGKQVGSTNLTIYGEDKRLLAVMDLVVSYDIEGLKAKLFEVMPEENIEARTVNGAVLLGGTVSTADHLDQALAIANRFAPEAVTNGLKVRGSQQVMLEVRFAEINRSTARQIGVDFSVTDDDFSFVTSGGFATAFGTAGLSTTLSNVGLDVFFDALEDKGLVKTLAEPTLVTLSGDKADFLAGGEFPFPVAQEEGTITIEFKEFGVGLAFTPTVISRNLVNMTVKAEVSNLDFTQQVSAGGVTVPGLSTRRANTVVEMRDGQSFAIAGLLQDNYRNAINQFPWLGDVPVLGALFRSTEFNRDATELVIVVTVRLVQPAASPQQIALPTDGFVPPTDVELFLLGLMQGEPGPLAAGAGITGHYGHIIE